MVRRGRSLPRVLLVALLWAGSLHFATPALARTFTVCPTGCNFTGIAAALEAADGGDTVSIGAGTYTGGFVVRKDVTLRGSGRDSTTIRGTNRASVIRVRSGAYVLIVGVTITGGGGTLPNNGVSGGGGILSNSTKPLQIFNSVISGNQAGGDGGGVYIREGETLITDTTSSGNRSNASGGGIRHAGGERLQVRQSVISDNEAVVSGGGVLVQSALVLFDSTVSGNTARFGGGLESGDKLLQVVASTISDNDTGDGVGGGIFVGDGGARLRDTRVSGNESERGAGVFTRVGDVTLTSSTIAGNIAAAFGGGIFNQSAELALTLSEVVDNRAGSLGGGIYVGEEGSARLGSGTVVSGNQPDQCFGATC